MGGSVLDDGGLGFRAKKQSILDFSHTRIIIRV
jgi:hypothetical protein